MEGVGQMPKPTERALKRKAQAVVMHDWEPSKVTEPSGFQDFEWFEGDKADEARSGYFDELVEWNKKDVEDHTGTDALFHLAVEVTDTASMTLGRIDVQPSDNDDLNAWVEKFKADPSLLIVATAAKATPSATAKKGTVKAKKASSASKAVQKGADGAGDKAPTPKKATAKKAPAKKAVEAKSAPKGAPAAKSAALKERLAAKRAKSSAEAEMAALDAAAATSG